ncbi:MAG: hypothetical protein JSW09_07125 [Pseudomonadota bacterium]|nr:MAG: hypothetical protein JSW09_07125 [Pseudomonadota bacterium]
MNTYRFYLYAQAISWGVLIATAMLPIGLDGDSRGWLLFFLLLPLLAAIPANIPALWRSTGWLSWLLIAIVACPAFAAIAGVLIPLALRASGWSAGTSWQIALESSASLPLKAGLLGAPLLLLLPVLTWFASRRRGHV